MSPTRFTLLALIATFALTSGCKFAYEEADFVTNRCSTDASCGDDARCDSALGMCVATTTSTVLVALEVIPPPASQSAGAVFSVSSFALNETSVLDVDMPNPAVVWGHVRWAGHGDANVPALISIVPSSTIIGHEPAAIQTDHNTEGFVGFNVPGAAFAGVVASNGAGPIGFDVIIRPTADAARDLPPRRLHAMTVPSANGTFEITNLDYPSELIEFVGDVVDAHGEPVPGKVVQAIDPMTGEVLSSTGMTAGFDDEFPGRFLIRIAPETTRYALRISSSNTDPNPMPAITLWPSYLMPDAEGVVLVGINQAETFTFSGTVEAEANLAPVEGALVQFKLQVDPMSSEATFTSFPVRTNASGQFSVQLIEGDYEIVITPPGDSINGHNLLGVSVETRHIQLPLSAQSIMGQVFSVPNRVELEGTVTTSDGRPMIGATIEAAALRRFLGPAEPASGLNRSNQAVTDHEGFYELPLDRGVYDLTLKPPHESGFPWLVIADFEVSDAAASTAPSVSGAPLPVSGILRDASGAPVANAELRAFAIIPNVGVAGQRSVQIGSTVSGPDGSYMLLLPPAL